MNDLPAVIWTNGTQYWYQLGRRHRDGGKPAAISANGSREYWYQLGRRHRDGGKPAVISANGSREYWLNGEFIL